MAGRRRFVDRVLRLIWPPVSHRAVKADVVDWLEDLRKDRDRFGDQEYARWRSAVFAGLAENRHREGAVAAVYGTAAAAFGVVSASLFGVGLTPWAVLAATAAVPFGVVALRMYCFWSARRRLSVGDRLAVVAEFVRLGLVTPAEAASLREGIDRLGLDHPRLHRRPADGPGPGWVPAYGPLPEFPALPPPPPLGQALYVHFWWGSQEFELVASAAAVRTVVCPWPDGEWAGRRLAWLQCKAVRRSDLRPDGSGPAEVAGYLIPAHYVTAAREWGPVPAATGPGGDFMGIYPPNQPPPLIAVPLDELKRLVTGLAGPARA